MEYPLAADPSLVYIEEPLDVHNPSPGVCACRFPCPFFRIDDSTADLYAPDLARMMALRFRYRDLLTSAPYPLSTLKRSLRGAQALLVGRTRGSVPLLKDPLALFSAEWLAERFGTRVLVLIRHPAAFAASLLRLNWRFNFVHFTDQKALLEGDLAPLASDLRAAEQTALPPIREAALLWKCLHVVIRRYMVDHADWTFLRLEDIASDPVLCFRNLAEVFALSRPDLVIERALLTSNASNPTSAPLGQCTRFSGTVKRRRLLGGPADIHRPRLPSGGSRRTRFHSLPGGELVAASGSAPMTVTRRPLPLTWVRRRISGRVGLRSVQLRQPLIALTFDDGPSDFTLSILAALDAHAVRATFFPLGNRAVRMPDTVRAVVQAGHEIGLHGWRHERFTRATVRAQLTISSRALFDLTGCRPQLFRAPYGELSRSSARVASRMGFRSILWDIDPHDWQASSAQSIVERVLVAAHPGAIILLHDGGGDRAPTVAALTAMIPALRGRGFEFGRCLISWQPAPQPAPSRDVRRSSPSCGHRALSKRSGVPSIFSEVRRWTDAASGHSLACGRWLHYRYIG